MAHRGTQMCNGRSEMIATRFNPLGIRPKTPAMRYIQDGLVVLLDGEENVGFGEHSDTTNVWKNLVGNGVDFTNLGEANWGENYAKFEKVANCFRSVNTDVFEQAFLDKTFTFEVVAEQVVGYQLQKFFNYGGAQTSGDFARVWLCGTATDSTRVGSGILYGSKRLEHYGTFPLKGLLRGYGDGQSVYRDYLTANGKDLTTSVTDLPTYEASFTNAFYIGYRSNYSPDGPMIQGQKIHCIRAYTRALSQEEMDYNYAIDKERFGI